MIVYGKANSSGSMAGLLKALFDSKPDYTEKIPDTLNPGDFNVHNVRKPAPASKYFAPRSAMWEE